MSGVFQLWPDVVHGTKLSHFVDDPLGSADTKSYFLPVWNSTCFFSHELCATKPECTTQHVTGEPPFSSETQYCSLKILASTLVETL